MFQDAIPFGEYALKLSIETPSRDYFILLRLRPPLKNKFCTYCLEY